MGVDVSSRKYRFAFEPNMKGLFSAADLQEYCAAYLQNFCGVSDDFTELENSHSSGLT